MYLYLDQALMFVVEYASNDDVWINVEMIESNVTRPMMVLLMLLSVFDREISVHVKLVEIYPVVYCAFSNVVDTNNVDNRKR